MYEGMPAVSSSRISGPTLAPEPPSPARCGIGTIASARAFRTSHCLTSVANRPVRTSFNPKDRQ